MSLYRLVFDGQLNRKRYVIALVVLLLMGGIAAQIGKEVGPSAFVLVWSATYLLVSILDAKRLRDIEASGKIALIAAVIFIFAWAPYTYDVLSDNRLPYPTPSFLMLMQTLYFGGHLYLLFTKGEGHKDKV